MCWLLTQWPLENGWSLDNSILKYFTLIEKKKTSEILLNFVSYDASYDMNIGAGSGLVPHRRQATNWTNYF